MKKVKMQCKTCGKVQWRYPQARYCQTSTEEGHCSGRLIRQESFAPPVKLPARGAGYCVDCRKWPATTGDFWRPEDSPPDLCVVCAAQRLINTLKPYCLPLLVKDPAWLEQRAMQAAFRKE